MNKSEQLLLLLSITVSTFAVLVQSSGRLHLDLLRSLLLALTYAKVPPSRKEKFKF